MKTFNIYELKKGNVIYQLKGDSVFRTVNHKRGSSTMPDFNLVDGKLVPTISNHEFYQRLVIRGSSIYLEGGMQALFRIKDV